MINIPACNNKYCKEYQDNRCERAIQHKEAITKREKFKEHISVRNNESACDMYVVAKKRTWSLL